jgi:hypothetical protein
MTLNRQQACELLHISTTTLWRRIKAGTYTSNRGEGQFAALSFTYADLGLTEPTSEPTPAPEPTRNPAPSKVGHYEDEPALRAPSREDADRSFAEAYRSGDATDSAGNKIDGTNERFRTKGIQSLLGPVEIERTPVGTTDHMHPALAGTKGPDASQSYLNSLERQRDTGVISVAQYDALQANSVKARRQCEQTNRVYLDRAAINAAFRHGYSR